MDNDFKQTSLYKDVPLITSDKTSCRSRRVGDVEREERAKDINVPTNKEEIVDREKIAKEIAKITMYWQHEGDIDELAIADWHIAELKKARREVIDNIAFAVINQCVFKDADSHQIFNDIIDKNKPEETTENG